MDLKLELKAATEDTFSLSDIEPTIRQLNSDHLENQDSLKQKQQQLLQQQQQRSAQFNKRKLQVCANCNKVGHPTERCWSKKSKLNQPTPKSEAVNFASQGTNSLAASAADQAEELNVVLNVLEASPHFIVDSGATASITNQFHLLNDPKFVNVDLKLANGTSFGASHQGTIIFDKGGEQIRIPEVLYSSNASNNLLSLTRLYQAIPDLRISNTLMVSDSLGPIAKVQSNGLYQFQLEPISNEISQLALLISSMDLNVHSRLGHPGQRLEEVVVNNPENDLPHERHTSHRSLCESCAVGKSHNALPKVSTTETPRVTQPLELVVADLAGPYSPSIYGEKYLLVIVDIFTKTLEVFPVPSKKEVAQCVQKFVEDSHRYFLNKGDYRVKTFRTDNGSEFFQGLTTYFNRKNIKHETTVPSHSFQNGTAERHIGLITTKARCLLHESGLPNSFWSEAIRAANHIRNRLPNTTSTALPFEHGMEQNLTLTSFAHLAASPSFIFPRISKVPRITSHRELFKVLCFCLKLIVMLIEFLTSRKISLCWPLT